MINRLNLLFICQSVTVYFVFLCSSRLYHKVEEIENFLFVSCVLDLNAKQISDSLNSETVLVLCKA